MGGPGGVRGRSTDRRSDDELAHVLALRGESHPVEIAGCAWSGTSDVDLVIEDHDSWTANLEREVSRAATHGRSLALVMFRVLGGRNAREWTEVLRSELRSFDRIALYSVDTVEVLLAEADRPEALAFAQRIVAGAPAVVCGVGVYPRHARSTEELIAVTRTALRSADPSDPLCAARRNHRRCKSPSRSPYPIVVSPALQRVYEVAERVATAAIPVLILGETGVGKELVARVIHHGSERRNHPIICVNCGGIPPELVESTLFGHEKGAYTGADRRVAGVFENANNGSVLLDEVGELSPGAQVSLLRVLETKRFVRVGGSLEREVDVRVLAATHQNLEAMVAAGRFRQDLLFRLDAIRICIPPLRQRVEEIEPLVARFVQEANRGNGCTVCGLEPDAMERLQQYRWPGNVRELKNAVERAVVIAHDRRICVEDLPERVRGLASPTLRYSELTSPLAPGPSSPIDLKTEVGLYEAALVLRALQQTDWNRREAAALLGIPLRTLARKIHHYRLGPEAP